MPDPDIAGPQPDDGTVVVHDRRDPATPAPSTPDPVTSDPTLPGPPRSPVRRRSTSAVTGPILERAIGRVLALSCLVFGVLALPEALRSDHVAQPLWTIVTQVSVFGSLAVAIAAVLAQVQVRRAGLLVVAAYAAALATWPLAAVDPSVTATSMPWLWYLLNVASGMAVLVLSPRAAIVVVVGLPALYGVVHATPSGGGASVGDTVFDSAYSLMVGLATFTLITVLRVAGRNLDAAQEAALARYAVAVREHANEKERMAVDALVHDSVLSTLLAAGRSTDAAARMRATRQARATLEIVDDVVVRRAIETATANVGATGTSDRTVSRLHDRVVALCAEYLVAPDIAPLDPADGLTPLPRIVADALLAAAVQAVGNSYLHAGGEEVQRTITITARQPETEGATPGALVVVHDDGAGFDLDAPTERLGVRVSIVDRVARVGGLATITSAPGAGTTIALCWPAPGS
ncbi:sensor histidine kinase [Frigoribacterium sp. 2-23]|uniref:sensor histidine kinase n=1 Tax=Frigoribacterium sp. 2-23 TaxID=3415006 RepID=UPI003C6F8EA2